MIYKTVGGKMSRICFKNLAVFLYATAMACGARAGIASALLGGTDGVLGIARKFVPVAKKTVQTHKGGRYR